MGVHAIQQSLDPTRDLRSVFVLARGSAWSLAAQDVPMSSRRPTYDSIGNGYNSRRAADARILAQLQHLLGQEPGACVLDVGAGTGNYTAALAEQGFQMWAIEPSRVMMNSAQASKAINWQIGSAEEMPYESDSFDAAYCTLSLHHFTDQHAGLGEIFRVLKPGGRLVVFTSDPRRVARRFWMREYFKEIFEQAENVFPSMVDLCKQLSTTGYVDTVTKPYPIPSDNQDGFFCSAWQRPSDYLDEQYRNGISSFRLMDAQRLEAAVARLEADLKSGRWHERFGQIFDLDEFDGGYTFVAANKALERTR